MLNQLKNILPPGLSDYILKYRIRMEMKRDSKYSTAEVFTRIYKKNMWGKNRYKKFNSGPDSSHPSVINPYINMITDILLKQETKPKAVDLGCGDFGVSVLLTPHLSEYIGVDIVEELINYNRQNFSHLPGVSFKILNIIEEELPEGDICFLRLVLQYLSNDQIKKILPKLNKYKSVFITEHYPADNNSIIPNIDKVHGRNTRTVFNSGVYLTKEPFCLPKENLKLVLEVKSKIKYNNNSPGMIRTFLYSPRK